MKMFSFSVNYDIIATNENEARDKLQTDIRSSAGVEVERIELYEETEL